MSDAGFSSTSGVSWWSDPRASRMMPTVPTQATTAIAAATLVQRENSNRRIAPPTWDGERPLSRLPIYAGRCDPDGQRAASEPIVQAHLDRARRPGREPQVRHGDSRVLQSRG